MQWLALGAIAAAALAADQVTKAIVRATLDFGEAAPGVGPFTIHHVRNSGILGGHLQGTAAIMAIVSVVVIAGLAVYFARNAGARPIFVPAFGLLIGGTLGNFVDRARLGYVTDFIDRDNGGAFNLADVSIFLGLAIVAAAIVLGRCSRGSRVGDSQPQPSSDAD